MGYKAQCVQPAQRLAELMIVRQNSKTNLPFKFWDDLAYKRNFVNQIRLAHSLLKLYSFEVIWEALHTKEGSRTYSLNAKWLDPILEKTQKAIQVKQKAQELKRQEPQIEEVYPEVIPSGMSMPIKDNLFNKLRNL